VQIRVPPGVFAGQEFEFLSPSGEVSRVRVPVGVRPGDEFVAQLAPAPPPVPMGAPVHLGAPAQTGGMGGGPTPLPATRARPLPAAARYAECPICFEPLHAGPVGVFLDGSGKRVSQHFFRLDAAREWLASGNGMCPITRAPIRSVRPVPNVQTDPDGWFAVCDVDGNGKLSRKEAIECIKAQYACDVAQLDAALTDEAHRMWRQWDVDGSGFIERHELLASPNGLALSVPRLFPPTVRGTMPNMRTDKSAWYDFFDEDHSGSLEREEVVRALIKTLGLSTNQAKVAEMRGTVQAIWPIFDTDGSGSIERGEFLRPNEGLADTILATLGRA